MDRAAERHRFEGEMVEQSLRRRRLYLVRDARGIGHDLRAHYDRDANDVGDVEPAVDVALRIERVVQPLGRVRRQGCRALRRRGEGDSLLPALPIGTAHGRETTWQYHE